MRGWVDCQARSALLDPPKLAPPHSQEMVPPAPKAEVLPNCLPVDQDRPLPDQAPGFAGRSRKSRILHELTYPKVLHIRPNADRSRLMRRSTLKTLNKELTGPFEPWALDGTTAKQVCCPGSAAALGPLYR